MRQDLSKLNAAELTPLSPEVISRQATINIGAPPALRRRRAARPGAAAADAAPRRAGTIGHVAHGKSTVVKAISGVQTVRFKNELERNITIKLGYANAKIYRARDPRVPRRAQSTAATQERSASWPAAARPTARRRAGGGASPHPYPHGAAPRRPWAYKAYGSSREDNPACDYPGFEETDMDLVRHVSFVDCPGARATPPPAHSGRRCCA